jgi:RNA polymerase sigma factor (sigma-70 family)
VRPDRWRSSAEDGSFGRVLQRAREQEPEAWSDLFHTYAPSVAGYLRLRGAAEPDDLTSEVFLAVFRGLERFDGDEAGFRSWLFVITHRRLQDEHRRRARRPEPRPLDDAVEVAGSRDTEGDALESLGTDRLLRLCGRLAPDQADVVLLRILGDLTVDQVATVLGKSAGAVKQLQRRGFDAIRRNSTRQGIPL